MEEDQDNSRLKIGEFNLLTIEREMEQGLYLTTGLQEVLLPKKFITPEMEIGKEIVAFIMIDSEDRPVAVMQQPKGTLGQIVVLDVVGLTSFGAFASWGVDKDLFIPKQLMRKSLEVDDKCVVRIEIDQVTGRLIGNPKFEDHLTPASPDKLPLNKEVQLIIYSHSPIGFSCLVNSVHQGLLYHNEIFKPLSIGDEIQGYIRQVREDGKIDLSLRPQGFDGIQGQEKEILEKLSAADGFLPFNDNSEPDEIRAKFQMSKKTFKKLIGVLYRQQLIDITHKGIKLK